MKLLILILIAASVDSFPGSKFSGNASFTVDYEHDRFLLDGEPFQYISGSIHYFRILPELWKDRLKKVRALGFNAIQYYIPWNYHEFDEGKYDFSGMRNFTEFSRIAADMGMWTLLRIGPYVCGEWENGGLPWWLLNKGEMKMRSSDPRFTTEVEIWFNTLLPIVKPLLRENGGPVLMVQIENEYGSYDACDRKYTAWLRDLARKHLGNNVVLYTTDGNSESFLKCGAVPDVLPTVDFGPQSGEAINKSFAEQRKYLPKGPLVNSEFYPGWLVIWGQKAQQLPATAAIVASAKWMYNLGANINFYMIHGGTNFGFWNGAETTAPCITSYDYTAPITEAGDVTMNFIAIRNFIKSIPGWKNKPLSVPSNSKKRAFGKIKLEHVDSITETLKGKTCVVSEKPQSFEKLNHALGYVMYYTKVKTCGRNLTIPLLKDFGFVYMGKEYQGTFVNRLYKTVVRSLQLNRCEKDDNLYILVENQGRQTYETINDYKGILSDVFLDGVALTNWTQCGVQLPLDVSQTINPNSLLNVATPGDHGVYFGELKVDEVADTFIDTTGWGKGVVIINGHNLGRYWASLGPQYTLYVPAQWLKKGANSLLVIETEGAKHSCDQRFCYMKSTNHPIFVFEEYEEAQELSRRVFI